MIPDIIYMYILINESVNGLGQATIAQTATGRAV